MVCGLEHDIVEEETLQAMVTSSLLDKNRNEDFDYREKVKTVITTDPADGKKADGGKTSPKPVNVFRNINFVMIRGTITAGRYTRTPKVKICCCRIRIRK